ncbi:hypothetical protein T484DRAFT_1762721 [Baffinella frigidus]|nr:hypothetical protein T484DRAFT_1762721 [Cryptophyta sp. CCMP2293]
MAARAFALAGRVVHSSQLRAADDAFATWADELRAADDAFATWADEVGERDALLDAIERLAEGRTTALAQGGLRALSDQAARNKLDRVVVQRFHAARNKLDRAVVQRFHVALSHRLLRAWRSLATFFSATRAQVYANAAHKKIRDTHEAFAAFAHIASQKKGGSTDAQCAIQRVEVRVTP